MVPDVSSKIFFCPNHNSQKINFVKLDKKKKDKGLVAIEQWRLGATIPWAQHMKDGVHPSLFAVLSFPDSKQVYRTDRVFQSPDGSSQVWTRDPSQPSVS